MDQEPAVGDSRLVQAQARIRPLALVGRQSLVTVMMAAAAFVAPLLRGL